MSTTALFVELVVVGIGGAMAAAVMAYASFGDNFLTDCLMSGLTPSGDVAKLIPVLSLVYVTGIVLDKISYRLFRGAESALRTAEFESLDGYYAARHAMFTSPNGGHAVEAFEYGRSKIRICRGWVLNATALSGGLSVALLTQHPDGVGLLTGSIGFAVLAVLCFWSWRVATAVEHRWLKPFHKPEGRQL